MATEQLPSELLLDPVGGRPRTLEEWLVNFQILAVVLDPFTLESSWLLETAGRILSHFQNASVRASFLLTCTEDEAREFLGPWAEQVLVFADPGRDLARVAGIEELPAIVHIRQNRTIEGLAQGWYPDEWQVVLKEVAADRHWTFPLIPDPGDPVPFRGTPALP